MGRGLLDQDSVSVLSTEFQYSALTKKSSVCFSNVLKLFLVFGVSSQGIGHGDRYGKDSGIDEGSFRVSNCNVPLLCGPLIGVFLAVGIYQLRSFSWVLKKSNFIKFHFDLGFRQMKLG